MRKIPLAWLQLIRERTRLIVASAGIAFAAVLIFVQLGFQDALYEGCTRPHNSLNADLVMVNPHFQTFFSVKSFSRTQLYQCLSSDGVESIAGLHVDKGIFKNPETGRSRDILTFACDPLELPFNLPGLATEISKLKMLNRILFDAGSRPEYGNIARTISTDGRVTTEVNDKQVCATGSFVLGASFSTDGNLLTGDSTFLRLFPRHHSDQVEVGLIRVKAGVSPISVQSQLLKHLTPGVTVLTIEQFASRERNYWSSSTGIGFIFGLGVAVGFVVGVVVVYQILYSDVCDHLAEYATLKAIGYTNEYLLSVVMKQALILTVFGYVPGVVLAILIYQIARAATLIPIYMTVERAALVGMLTLMMSSISALIAMKKLREADPADIF